MAALLQFLYASFTFYRTIGGQVNQYGFAAPGFTVLPYAVMSALNLMANLVAPHYPTLYLIRTEVMEEAERRTGLPFHYVVGEAVDESGTNNIVMEGWSEIAGSFKDDDEQLYVSPSTEAEDDKIKICDSSQQTIYVPACPRFRRTDDSYSWISPPLRRISLRWGRLEFPRYMVAGQSSILLQLQSYMENRLRRRPRLSSNKTIHPFGFELHVVWAIIVTELFTIFALSNFSGQQSTLAQRTWTVTWLLIGGIVSPVLNIFDRFFKELKDMPPMLLFCLMMASHCAPAIGGFVVVSQMLKAYGICYEFVSRVGA